MCSIDLDRCDVFRETPRMARKPRWCSCCYRLIQAGEAYLYHFSLSDGPCVEAACFACWCAREEFMDGGHPLFNPSALPDLLSECMQGDEEATARWAPLWQSLRDRSSAARAGEA